MKHHAHAPTSWTLTSISVPHIQLVVRDEDLAALATIPLQHMPEVTKSKAELTGDPMAKAMVEIDNERS